MLEYERALWNKGYTLIAGIDEAGRGSLAGSVVAAAVILPVGLIIDGIKDSKELSPKQREELYLQILNKSIAVAVGVVNEREIEKINIKQASRLAMKKAVNSLRIYPQYLLIDAEVIDLNLPQLKIVKGDKLSQSIAAASIVAKVTRDRMCCQWDSMYPQYGFKRHKGYCTKEHCQALRVYGASPLHRKNFVKNVLQQGQERFEQISLFFGVNKK
ncbi:MAG: Ribonuclease HII [Clostridia bacterium 41_269]|nr:MAG: Ribonuclease HII [Clostridia bacterium 41_269]